MATNGKSTYGGQIEVENRNVFENLAMKQGYIMYKPSYDVGIDFILYRESDDDLKKVQLKSRWAIAKKYVARDIWVAFPIAGAWYLMPHDEMVSAADAGILASVSWTERGGYSRSGLTAAAIEKCAPYRFTQTGEL